MSYKVVEWTLEKCTASRLKEDHKDGVASSYASDVSGAEGGELVTVDIAVQLEHEDRSTVPALTGGIDGMVDIHVGMLDRTICISLCSITVDAYFYL